MFNIICINNMTGKRYPSGFLPTSYRCARVLVSKMTAYPWRTIIIEEVKP